MKRASPRRVGVTREGAVVLALTLGVGLGAVNSGNNLLYLIVGMLLSLIVVSGILSEASLRGLSVRRETALTMRAGAVSRILVEITNGKRRLGATALEVTERVHGPGISAGVQMRPGLALHIKAGERARVWVQLRPAQRGQLVSVGVRVATRYPFGFFEKSRMFYAPRIWAVHPQIVEAEWDGSPGRGSGEFSGSDMPGMGSEPYGVRGYRQGDDPRAIAWRLSARRQTLITREYERPVTRHIALLVLGAVPNRTGARARFEASVAQAAALAEALLEDGVAVALWTASGSEAPGTGPAHGNAILDRLALLPARVLTPSMRPPAIEAHETLGGLGTGVECERWAVVSVDQDAAGWTPEADRVFVVGEPL